MRKPASFLTSDQRAELLKILRQRKSAALVARRAHALLLLDDGKSTGFVARALFLDPDTVRVWLREFRATGLASVDLAACPEREGKLNRDQEAALKALFRTTLRATPTKSGRSSSATMASTIPVRAPSS